MRKRLAERDRDDGKPRARAVDHVRVDDARRRTSRAPATAARTARRSPRRSRTRWQGWPACGPIRCAAARRHCARAGDRSVAQVGDADPGEDQHQDERSSRGPRRSPERRSPAFGRRRTSGRRSAPTGCPPDRKPADQRRSGPSGSRPGPFMSHVRRVVRRVAFLRLVRRLHRGAVGLPANSGWRMPEIATDRRRRDTARRTSRRSSGTCSTR